jgi:hypothetical protein
MGERSRAHRLAAVLVCALAPSLAGAEGLSAYVEEDYTNVSARSTDQTGRTTHSTTDEIAQHYRLMFDKTLFPFVRVDAFGLFEKTNDWITTDGVPSKADEWRAGGSAHLRLGPPILGGDLGYDRRDDSTGSSLTAARVHTVSEIYSAHAGWRPADWPSIDLRLSRTDNYDVNRQLADNTNDQVLVTSEYSAFRQLRLGYNLNYQHGTDRLTTTVTNSLVNTARAYYSDTFNAGRTAVQASYQLNSRTSETMAQGVGGVVTTPQLPAAGLSLVEAFPAVPETDTLVQNPALVDGNLTVSASVNLGFSVALAGDSNFRDLGVQFTDPTTPVNTFWVWVDRPLPADIAGTFAWSAFSSDDNVNWTRVNVAAPVVFSPFQNRFEITIDQTRARYLKVVTRPLAAAITADRRFSDIFVTELQPVLVVSAQSVRGSASTTVQTATGSLRHELLANRLLVYDLNGILNTGTGGSSYTIQTGLTLERRLAPALLFSSRVARQDTGQSSSGQPGQHSGLFQYGASLVATPLATLTDSLTYTGQYAQTPRGTGELNSVTFVNRAQLYRGIDALASAAYSYNVLDTGQTAQGPTVIASLSLVPNRILALAGSYYLSRTHQSGGNLPEQDIDNERVDGTVTLSPFPALYLSATVTRVIQGTVPTTLATLSGTFSPFPDGTVLLRSSYVETFDTSQHAKSGVGTAGLRWNISPRAFLDVSYSIIDSSSNAGSGESRSFLATLVIQL